MIYEKEIKCISNEICTEINDEIFYMISNLISYGFEEKLWKSGDNCSLPIKISIKIELNKEKYEKDKCNGCKHLKLKENLNPLNLCNQCKNFSNFAKEEAKKKEVIIEC